MERRVGVSRLAIVVSPDELDLQLGMRGAPLGHALLRVRLPSGARVEEVAKYHQPPNVGLANECVQPGERSPGGAGRDRHAMRAEGRRFPDVNIGNERRAVAQSEDRSLWEELQLLAAQLEVNQVGHVSALEEHMKLVVRIIGGLLVLIVVAVTAVFAVSQREFTRTHDYPVGPIAVPADSAALARGRHLATALGKCVACHGDDLGGQVFMDNGAMGRFVAPNLTSGSEVKRTPADLERALRHGIGSDGRALAFMPSQSYAHLSTADMSALIAYVQSVPAVTRELPERKVGPIARMIVATNQARLPVEEIDHAATPASTVPEAVTVEYGKYLADVGGCTGCHSPNLAGGKQEGPPGTPPASNLTRGGRDWTLPDFTRALREGVRPGGTPIDSFMPWKLTRLMTDAEIEAVWMYVRSVPPRAFGEK